MLPAVPMRSILLLAFLVAAPAFAQGLPSWVRSDRPLKRAQPEGSSWSSPAPSTPPPPPAYPDPVAVPIDGGLGLLVLAGGALAARRLRRRRDDD